MHRFSLLGIILFSAVLTCGLSLAFDADEKTEVGTVKVNSSGKIPAEDYIAQIDFFIERLEEGLESNETYNIAFQARARKDAATIFGLALCLRDHPEDHKLKKSAGTIINAAKTLVHKYEDFKTARNALDTIKKAVSGVSANSGDPESKGDGGGDIVALMKQVPLIESRLKRGVSRKSRLARGKKKNAGYAASLVAIARASIHVGPEKNATQWKKFCVQMQDASVEVNGAVRRDDFDAIGAAMKKMYASCHDCHAVFRKDPN